MILLTHTNQIRSAITTVYRGANKIVSIATEVASLLISLTANLSQAAFRSLFKRGEMPQEWNLHGRKKPPIFIACGAPEYSWHLFQSVMGASKSFNIILHDPIITIQCHHWMVFSANFVTPEAQVVTASAAKLLSSHLVGCLIVAGDRSTNLSRLQKWRPGAPFLWSNHHSEVSATYQPTQSRC